VQFEVKRVSGNDCVLRVVGEVDDGRRQIE
jgi:hypothetical protein